MSLRTKRGQNTAEYLIMLTLIVVGSITLWTAFGKTIHSKIAFVSAAIAGDSDKYDKAKTRTSTAAEKANTAAREKQVSVEGISKEDLTSGQLQ